MLQQKLSWPIICASAALASVLSLWPATIAHAARYWKNGVINGTWSGTNNWSGVSAAGGDNAGPPPSSDTAFIVHNDGTPRTVTYDANSAAPGILYIDLALARRPIRSRFQRI
jgi:hypothetical protein